MGESYTEREGECELDLFSQSAHGVFVSLFTFVADFDVVSGEGVHRIRYPHRLISSPPNMNDL